MAEHRIPEWLLRYAFIQNENAMALLRKVSGMTRLFCACDALAFASFRNRDSVNDWSRSLRVLLLFVLFSEDAGQDGRLKSFADVG